MSRRDKEPEALTVKEFLCLLCSESDFNGNALNQSRFLKDMWTHLDALDFARL